MIVIVLVIVHTAQLIQRAFSKYCPTLSMCHTREISATYTEHGLPSGTCSGHVQNIPSSSVLQAEGQWVTMMIRRKFTSVWGVSPVTMARLGVANRHTDRADIIMSQYTCSVAQKTHLLLRGESPPSCLTFAVSLSRSTVDTRSISSIWITVTGSFSVLQLRSAPLGLRRER